MTTSLPRNIENAEQVLHYIQTTNNIYTEFIHQKINAEPSAYRRQNLSPKKGFEYHHIIPLYANGPDIDANIIQLSYDDHTQAHFLLFQVYQNYFDYCTYCMRRGKTAEGAAALRKANVIKMKEEKRGRFSSESQQKCGLQNKGVTKKSHSKNPLVTKALQQGMIWKHENGTELIIAGGQCKGLTDLVILLISECTVREQTIFAQKKLGAPIYISVSKLITGWRDKKTNKCVFRAGGWKLLGIFLKNPVEK